MTSNVGSYWCTENSARFSLSCFTSVVKWHNKTYTITQVTWLVVTEVRSKSFGLVTEHCQSTARPIYVNCSSARPVVFFILECGITHFLCPCACCVHIQCRSIILTPYASLVPNFVSVVSSTAELASREKLDTQSLNHSPILFRYDGNRSEKCIECLERNSILYSNCSQINNAIQTNVTQYI